MQACVNTIAVEKFSEKLFRQTDRRIVTIWGAGTSIKSGVPSGYYLMERMRRDLAVIITSDYCRERLGSEYDAIAAAIHPCSPQPVTFEYVMMVYSRVYGREKLYPWLKKFIRPMTDDAIPPYYPGFSHEYCAHLAKLGRLRYFISTNFDELLESSLEEELGNDGVRVIASRSEFESLRHVPMEHWKRKHGFSLARCFLFKPHGTISRSLTLRETPQGVAHFEAEKGDVLTDLLKDATIVFLGFGNYNQNFWLLFGETYSMGMTDDVFVVDLNPAQVLEKLPDPRLHNDVYAYTGDVDAFFDDVAAKAPDEPLWRRQTPTRHRLRARYFSIYHRKLTRIDCEAAFKDRLTCLSAIADRWWYDVRIYELELLIHLFKARGLFIQLAVSDCPRVRRAYLACLEWKRKHPAELPENEDLNLEPTAVLARMLNDGYEDQYIRRGDVVDRFGEPSVNIFWCFLVMPKGLRNTFIAGMPANDHAMREKLKGLLTEYCQEVAQRYTSYLCRRIPCGCPPDSCACIRRGIEDGQFAQSLADRLGELMNASDVDIVESDLSASMRFRSPITVDSRKSLDDMTSDLMAIGGRLRVASFCAEWLISALENRSNVRSIEIISNIVSFKTFTDRSDGGGSTEPIELFHYHRIMLNITQLIHALRDNQDISEITVAWYAIRHLQHHMTIASAADLAERRERAVYFRRPGKNAAITPVFLEHPEDIRVLIDYFDTRIDKLNALTRTRIGKSGAAKSGGSRAATIIEGGRILTIVKARGKTYVKIEHGAASPLGPRDQRCLLDTATRYQWPIE
jgi:hypothetical protein